MPNQYDPSAQNPYEAPQLPDPGPTRPSPFGGQPGFQFGPQQGNISHAGAIAGVADNILRGFMNGRAQGEAYKALRLKKQSDDAQASYNSAASRLLELHKSGVDENSPEYKSAKQAVDGSFAGLMSFYGQHIQPPDTGGKKSKGKQVKDGIMGMLQSKDPMMQSQAWYQVMQKAGPPVYHQIEALNGPRNKQAQATGDTNAQAQSVHAGNTLTHEQAQATYDKYAGMSAEQLAHLPETEQQSFRNAQAILRPEAAARGASAKENATWLKGTDGKMYPFELRDGKYVAIEGAEGMEPIAKITGSQKPVRAFVNRNGKPTSVLLDPATNQEIPGSENAEIQPPASMVGRVSTSHYMFTDNDNNVHDVPITRTSTPIYNRGGAAPHPPAPRTATPPASDSSAPPAVAPPSTAPRPRTVRTAAPVAPTATPANAPGIPPRVSPTGDRIVGHKGPKKATPKEFADLEEKTHEQYTKAHDKYIADISVIDSKDFRGDANAVRNQAVDNLKRENDSIGATHSQALRSLGGIPAEDSRAAAVTENLTPPATPQIETKTYMGHTYTRKDNKSPWVLQP